MTVYSLTETAGNAGCYGVFSSEEKATAAAIEFIKSWEYSNAEETVFDGFHKCIYYGEDEQSVCFEIWKHELDAK
jgi:hypothetical protein